jgi:hypothetical protein
MTFLVAGSAAWTNEFPGHELGAAQFAIVMVTCLRIYSIQCMLNGLQVLVIQ